jgi:plastocyanin
MLVRKLLFSLLLAFTFGGLGACGNASTTPSIPNAVTMTTTNFVTHSIKIRAGNQVTFVDPKATGGQHTLYFGNNGLFIPNKNGPSAFNSKQGVNFGPGDSRGYAFATRGVYEVTCSDQPRMNVIITVM